MIEGYSVVLKTMRFEIITIFPSFFDSPLQQGILKKAIDKGIVEIRVNDLRDYTTDRHRVVDDYPYGGGEGMVMKVEPLYNAVVSIKERCRSQNLNPWVILLSPQGERFSQERAEALSKRDSIIIICGRYQGVDDRLRELVVDQEISIGDYVLGGGETAALVVIETVSRLIKGVVGCERSVEEDSFSMGLLEYPHYTRPAEFMGIKVPDVLLSGDHKAIRRWRRIQALKRTLEKRPDMLEGLQLSDEDRSILDKLKRGSDVKQ